jgi:hypothetical protein
MRASTSPRAIAAVKARDELARNLAHKILDALLEKGSFSEERLPDDAPIPYHLTPEDEEYLSGQDYRVLLMPRSFLDDVNDGVAKRWAYARNTQTHPNTIVTLACEILTEALALAFAGRVPDTRDIFASYGEIREMNNGVLRHREYSPTGEVGIFFPIDYDDKNARDYDEKMHSNSEDYPPEDATEPLSDEELAWLTPKERANLERYAPDAEDERENALSRTQSGHDDLFYLDLRVRQQAIHDAIDAAHLRAHLRTHTMPSGRTH